MFAARLSTLLPQPVTITLGLLDTSRAVYAPTLTPKNTLTLGLLDASPALYAPTITPDINATANARTPSPP